MQLMRMEDNLPLAVGRSCVPSGFSPNLLEQSRVDDPPYDLFREGYRREVALAGRTVKAALTTLEESELLNLHERQRALRIEKAAMDDSRRPVH